MISTTRFAHFHRQVLRLTALGLVSAAAATSASLPTGEQVQHGNASFTRSAGENQLRIDQGTQRAIIQWEDFSIGSDGVVRFVQPDGGAVLNRVATGGAASEIFGQLEGSGQVFLINPAGIVFGEGAAINAHSFVASTLNVSNEEFLDAGEMLFLGDSDSAIINRGSLTATEGDVVLIARTISQEGTITAESGTAALVTGSEVLIGADLPSRVFVRPAEDNDTAAATVTSTVEQLAARNGNPYALAINSDGIARATTVSREDGRVMLNAGGAEDGGIVNSGTIRAENVTVSARRDIRLDGAIEAQELLTLRSERGSLSQSSAFETNTLQVSAEGDVSLTNPENRLSFLERSSAGGHFRLFGYRGALPESDPIEVIQNVTADDFLEIVTTGHLAIRNQARLTAPDVSLAAREGLRIEGEIRTENSLSIDSRLGTVSQATAPTAAFRTGQLNVTAGSDVNLANPENRLAFLGDSAASGAFTLFGYRSPLPDTDALTITGGVTAGDAMHIRTTGGLALNSSDGLSAPSISLEGRESVHLAGPIETGSLNLQSELGPITQDPSVPPAAFQTGSLTASAGENVQLTNAANILTSLGESSSTGTFFLQGHTSLAEGNGLLAITGPVSAGEALEIETSSSIALRNSGSLTARSIELHGHEGIRIEGGIEADEGLALFSANGGITQDSEENGSSIQSGSLTAEAATELVLAHPDNAIGVLNDLSSDERLIVVVSGPTGTGAAPLQINGAVNTGGALEIDTTGNIVLADSGSLRGETVNLTGPYGIRILGPVEADEILTLSAEEGSIEQTAALTADSLSITAGGNAELANPDNRLNALGESNIGGNFALAGRHADSENEALVVTGPVSTGGLIRLVLTGSLILNAPLSSEGEGDAIVIVLERENSEAPAPRFVNYAGSNALGTTDEGRWLVYLETPQDALFGGLRSASTEAYQVSPPADPWADSMEETAVEGNGFLFSVTLDEGRPEAFGRYALFQDTGEHSDHPHEIAWRRYNRRPTPALFPVHLDHDVNGWEVEDPILVRSSSFTMSREVSARRGEEN